MKNIIRKSDIILFLILISIGVLLSVLSFANSHEGKMVVVKVDGELYGTYPLDENREIIIENDNRKNKIIINESSVQMLESSCHNKICVMRGGVTNTHDMIVCLPNRVVIEVTGEGGDYDVVTG